MVAMFRLRSVASALCSLAWKVSIPVVGASVLIGILLKESDDQTKGAELPSKGWAVFSDQGTNVLVTLSDAGTRGFSTCVMQDQGGKEIARVNSYPSGDLIFSFGNASTVRGSGTSFKDGAVNLGVSREAKHQYTVSVQPDGSSVVQTIVYDDSGGAKVRTVGLSPNGDVLSEQP
jgi:hypothetical protein